VFSLATDVSHQSSSFWVPVQQQVFTWLINHFIPPINAGVIFPRLVRGIFSYKRQATEKAITRSTTLLTRRICCSAPDPNTDVQVRKFSGELLSVK